MLYTSTARKRCETKGKIFAFIINNYGNMHPKDT